MRPVNFVDPARYEPRVYLNDATLAERMRSMPWLERCAFAELLAGNIKTHIVYAVRADNEADTLAVPDGPGCIPVLRDGEGDELARQFKPGMSLTVNADGAKISLSLPPLAKEILARVDGVRNLGDIHASIAAEDKPGRDWIGFKNQFDALYGAFYGVSRMFLRSR